MIIAFIIWSIVSLIFLSVGITSWKAKEPVGFFTGVKPAKMEDNAAYNRTVAKIWFAFAGVLEVIGIPMLFLEQNSPAVVLIVFAVIVLVIVSMVVYMSVEKKYKE